MTALAGPALGLVWTALVLALAARHRPAPARVRSFRPLDGRSRGRRRAVAPTPSELARGVGAVVLRLAGRRPGRDDVDDRATRLGGAVLAAVPAAVVNPWPPILPAIAAAAAWWWPVRRRRRQARQRAERIAGAVPDVVDLFLLAVDAGLTVPLALRAVAARTTGPLGDELTRTVDAVDLGRRTADALDDLARPDRAGEAVRPLVAALAASERYGAPLASSLVRLADEARRQRRRRAEEAARRLPVTLLFPLVTCTLPAFGLLTVGPLIASAVQSLRL